MLTRRDIALRRGGLLVVLVSIALAAGGCGGDDEARSEQRPPVPVNVSVLVGTERVTASPAEAGAGPITFLIANQSGASQTVTVEGPRVTRSAGPIPPDDTATLKLTAQTGEYTISTEESAGLDPATLDVGPPRPSGQNDLLLP